jgi:hypothetical protein
LVSPYNNKPPNFPLTSFALKPKGLYKLQLIRDAKRICSDVVIKLGEDISRFRDASKELYRFLRAFSWNGRVERLGFDEVRLTTCHLETRRHYCHIWQKRLLQEWPEQASLHSSFSTLGV